MPSNAKKSITVKSVKEILGLDTSLKNIEFKDNKFFMDDVGIAKTGTYYNTNKPFEIAFIIRFLEKYINNTIGNKNGYMDFLLKKADEKYGQVIITMAKNEKGELLSLDKKDPKNIVAADNKNGTEKEPTTKSAAVFHALLHFFDPDEYEPIVSMEHKEKIVKNLYDGKNENCKKQDFKPEIDWQLSCIRKKYQSEIEQDLYFFYSDEIREQWDPSILPAKNVIYYGAPGTGKTHDILALIEAKINAQCSKDECKEEYYEIVQFHPSYSYEDFIDGIKPVKSSNNNSNITLELVDGVFKNMCKRAYAELKNNPTNPKKFYFIADEINRAELSRVFGELLLCIEEDKRLKFIDGKLEGVKIKTQNSTLWEKENAVVVVDTDKCKKGNGLYFGVPENIYFLATMNDIDKSIDSFDLALRRRFKWVYKGCDYDVIYNNLLEQGVNDDDIATYISDDKKDFGRCRLLNNYINKTLNLGDSYELGHSYFMNIKIYNGKIPKNAYNNLFDLELAPLLSEYLRAEISSPKELKDKLSCMKKIFTGEECK